MALSVETFIRLTLHSVLFGLPRYHGSSAAQSTWALRDLAKRRCCAEDYRVVMMNAG
jgi:hypothetical protein